MEEWDIYPYIGVGEIEFGMSPEEVSKFLGPVVSREERSNLRGLEPGYARYYKGLATEFRELPVKKKPVVSFRNSRAELMDFTQSAKSLRVGGIHLFKGGRGAVVDALMNVSKIVYKDREGFKFLDLGITLSSKDYYRDNPNIGVFARGHFDHLIERGLSENLGQMVRGAYSGVSTS